MKSSSARESNDFWSIWGTNISNHREALAEPRMVTSAGNVLLRNGAVFRFFKDFLRFQAVRLQAVIINSSYSPQGVVVFPLSVF